MNSRDRLRIAIQKSGRLTEPALGLLKRCGLTFRQSRDKLFCFGEGEPVDLLLVRDDDIPGLIAQSVCDLGIVGRNVLAEFSLARAAEGAHLREWRALGFGRCRLSIAVPQTLDYCGSWQLAGQRIATSYPTLLRQWLDEQGIAVEVVTLAGSVEIAPRLGTADSICDLVQSGATLAANQLQEVDVLLESEAVLAGAETPPTDERGDMLELLLKRLDGVIQLRESCLLWLQTPKDALDAIIRKLPDGAQPTLFPLAGQPDQLMLQALCSGEVSWRRMEEIKRAGASGMFVVPVEKMLA